MKKSNQNIDLRFVMGVILYHWKLLIIPMIIAPIGALIAMNYLPEKFRASAKLMVQENAMVNPFLSKMSENWMAQGKTPVIEGVLTSRTTVEKTLRRLNELRDGDTPRDIEDRVTDFGHHIKFLPLGSGMVQIEMTGSNPDMVYKGLEVLVQVLIEEMRRPQKDSVADANSFLKRELDRLSKELTSVEDELAKFKQENAGQLPEVQQANLGAYLSYQKALMDAEIGLISSRGKKRLMEEKMKKFNPAVQALEKQLTDSRAKLSELQATYTGEHPGVRAMEAQVSELEQKLAQAQSASAGSAGADDGAGGVENKPNVLPGDMLSYKQAVKEMDSLSSTVGMLRKHIDDSQQSVKAFASKEKTLARLLRDLEIKSKVYKNILEKHEDSQITKELALYDDGNQVWVVEPAALPTRPMGLPRAAFLLLSVLGGLMFGGLLVFAVEFFSNTIRKKEEVEALVGVPVIGTIPRLTDNGWRVNLVPERTATRNEPPRRDPSSPDDVQGPSE
jgi:polysaccharide chain length determinant protein (PEP-CTERM system associated)